MDNQQTLENLPAEALNLSTDQIKLLLETRQKKERQERETKKLSYEQLRNDTVDKLVPMANTLREQMVAFKKLAFGEIVAVQELLREYSSRHENGKGNFEIKNSEGSMRIKYRSNQFGYFDERSMEGEKHIIEFLDRQFAGDPNTRDLLRSLLQRSKGKLDINQVQRLYKYEDTYDDFNWKEGIKLIKESWTPANTKWYAQFEVLINETWTPIVLNFASIEL